MGMDGKLIVDDIFKLEEIENFVLKLNVEYGFTLNLKDKFNESNKLMLDTIL